MRLIPADQLGLRLRECAVTNRTSDKEGFIETGNVMSATEIKAGRPHEREIFISIAAVKEMARMVGWVAPEEVDSLKQRIEDMGGEFAQAAERLEKIETIQRLEGELEEVAA